MGFWYVGTGTASIMGALVAYGLLFYTGDRFHSWQIMFLIFGLVTIAVGIIVIVFLPDNPMTSRLSHEEKVWAIERLRENKTGIENKHFKMEQFLEVWRDPQTYFIAIIVTAINVPNGAVGVISVLSGTYLAGRFDQRCLCIIGILICGLLGGCLMAFSREDVGAAKLTGNYLTNFVGAALPLMYSLAGANVAGHTKKVTMNAVLLMSFCLGNILGPLTFRTKDEPEYVPAKIAIVATVSVGIVFTLLLKLYYMWENRRRDANKEGLEHQENSEFMDLTDMQNKEFRVSRLIFF